MVFIYAVVTVCLIATGLNFMSNNGNELVPQSAAAASSSGNGNNNNDKIIELVDKKVANVKQKDSKMNWQPHSRHSNVLDGELEVCSVAPLTGYTRTGYCETNEYDQGTHLVCAKVTKEFLSYTKARGNDLSTPNAYFPGLKPGDNWCLCVRRWAEAYQAGAAPPVQLGSTHSATLSYLRRYNLGLEDLKSPSVAQK